MIPIRFVRALDLHEDATFGSCCKLALTARDGLKVLRRRVVNHFALIAGLERDHVVVAATSVMIAVITLSGHSTAADHLLQLHLYVAIAVGRLGELLLRLRIWRLVGPLAEIGALKLRRHHFVGLPLAGRDWAVLQVLSLRLAVDLVRIHANLVLDGLGVVEDLLTVRVIWLA